MNSLEEEMQILQKRVEKKEVMWVDDDHFTNSELSFSIEEPVHNLCMRFSPQWGSDNVMMLDIERIEYLIDVLKYYSNKMKNEVIIPL